MKNILITDKGNMIDFVIQSLEKIYGETVRISRNGPWFTPNLQNGAIDLFFISGKAILDGEVDPKKYKELYGNPNAKVVAISTDPSYLKEIEEGDYGVDYFQDKEALSRLQFHPHIHPFYGLSEAEFEKIEAALKSYLN